MRGLTGRVPHARRGWRCARLIPGDALAARATAGGGGIDFGRDRLIWLGDYIDGGPDSDLVVQCAIELQRGQIVSGEHLRWLGGLDPWTETDSFAFVHAGIDPRLPTFADNDPDTTLWIWDEFIRSARDWGKRVTYGHTHLLEPQVMSNKIGINTLHRSGGYLTAVILSDDEPAAYRFIRT